MYGGVAMEGVIAEEMLSKPGLLKVSTAVEELGLVVCVQIVCGCMFVCVCAYV